MLRKLDLADLEFDRVPVLCHSTRGTPYTRWASVGMPKIPSRMLDCAFYLYPSEEEARRGGKAGGTGFFVGIRSQVRSDCMYMYAVTNHHVLTSGSSVIRLNTVDGGTDIFETDPSDWTFKPGGDDVAVLPFQLREGMKHSCIEDTLFATEEDVRELEIGPGDDVFMIGRFVDHDGGASNVPAVRFGNISVNPTVIHDSQGHKSLSYILDIHSRTGYSGSPVFFYRTHGADITSAVLGGVTMLMPAKARFLGIHYSQFPEEWEIRESAKRAATAQAAPLLLDEKKHVVVGMSGMTCAIPAWRVRELLDHPAIARPREAEEVALSSTPAYNGPMPEAAASNSRHREDFNSLLDAAVRGKP